MNEVDKKSDLFPLPRVEGDKIILGEAHVFEPRTLALIRERFADSRVLVVDANGVLCSPEPFVEEKRINPEALETLQALNNHGYELVLLTDTSRIGMSKVFESEVLNQFKLCIFGENYVHQARKPMLLGEERRIASEEFHKGAVNSTEWLSEDEKLKTASNPPGLMKHPFVLFYEYGMIEDESNYLWRYLDKESSERYPFFSVCPFGGDREYREVYIKKMGKLPEFGTNTIEHIVERFPPR